MSALGKKNPEKTLFEVSGELIEAQNTTEMEIEAYKIYIIFDSISDMFVCKCTQYC